MSDVSNSLMSLTKNERAWAIGSEEMSDRDQIARFFWVNRSFAHFFLQKNKRFAQKTDEQIPSLAGPTMTAAEGLPSVGNL